MQKNQITIYTIIILSGLLAATLSIYEQESEDLEIDVREGHTYVDGVMAPHLSELPFHMSYIDDETCLNCHVTARELNILGQKYNTTKIKHEIRDNCSRCHTLANH